MSPRAPRPGEARHPDERDRLSRVGALASALRAELVERGGLDERRAFVRVVEAEVRDGTLDPEGADPWRVTSAQALVGPDADRPEITRLTLPRESPAAWPAGFLDALRRQVRAPSMPELRDATPWRRCPAVVFDAFAFADLLRAAAGAWRSGTPGQALPLSPELLVEERDLLRPAGTPATIVRRGRLRATPETLGVRTRASWRERPRLDWRGLDARLPRLEREPLEPGTLLVTTLHFLPGALLGSGCLLDAAGESWSIPLLELPRVDRCLASLIAQIGPRVPDVGGLPVLAPPVLAEGNILFSPED